MTRKIFYTYLLMTVVVFSQQSHDRSIQPQLKLKTAFAFPSVKTYELTNGLRVMFVQKKTVPVVEMELLINAGTNKEEFLQAGISALVIQMLFLGTKNMSADDFARVVDRHGMTMFSSTQYEYSFISVRCMKEYNRQAFDVLSEAVMNPTFPEEYLPILKSQFKNRTEQQLREPSQIASILFYTQIYGNTHPYSRSIYGTFEALDSISISDVRQFYSSFYRPNNATLLISGDVDADAMMKIIHDKFDLWSRADIPVIVHQNFPTQDSLRILVLHDSTAKMAQVRIGNLSIPRSSQEFYSSLLLNQILGAGAVSRISINLLGKKHIAASMRTAFGYHSDIGFFVAAGACENKSVPSVIHAVLEEMTSMMNSNATPAGLSNAKLVMKKSYALECETNGQLIRKLREHVAYSINLYEYDQYEKRIDAITEEDLTRAAQLALDPKRASIVVVGNADELYQPLSSEYKTRVRFLNPAAQDE